MITQQLRVIDLDQYGVKVDDEALPKDQSRVVAEFWGINAKANAQAFVCSTDLLGALQELVKMSDAWIPAYVFPQYPKVQAAMDRAKAAIDAAVLPAGRLPAGVATERSA